MTDWSGKEIKIFKISKNGLMADNFVKTFLDPTGETRRKILSKIDDHTLTWNDKMVSYYRNGGKIHWWGETLNLGQGKARYLQDLEEGSEIFFLDPKSKIYKTHFLKDNSYKDVNGAKLSQILWGSANWNLVYCFLEFEAIDYDIDVFKRNIGWPGAMTTNVVLSTKGTSTQKVIHNKFFTNHNYTSWISQYKSVSGTTSSSILSNSRQILKILPILNKASPITVSESYKVRVQVDGWIYLMHPEEFLFQSLAVYKVGKTTSYHHEKRTKSYGEEGIPLGIWAVPLNKLDDTETELKKLFNEMITPAKGTEYFSLPSKLMIQTINSYIASSMDESSPCYEDRMSLTYYEPLLV